MDGDRNLGCTTLLFMLVGLFLLITSIDNATTQLKRIANAMETRK